MVSTIEKDTTAACNIQTMHACHISPGNRAQSANDAIITARSANRMCMHAGLLHLKSCTHKPAYCKNNAHAHCVNQRKDSIISSHSTHSPLCSRTSTVDPPVQWHTATNLDFYMRVSFIAARGGPR